MQTDGRRIVNGWSAFILDVKVEFTGEGSIHTCEGGAL